MIRLIDLIESNFNDLFHKKNKWIELKNKGDLKRISDELYVLINGAYGKLGGHVGIKSPADITKGEYSVWQAVDIDVDPEADAVIFGKKRNGFKMSGIGHDGQSNSKRSIFEKLSKQLSKPGYWVEASGKVRQILLQLGTPYVDDQKIVEKIFKQKVDWQGNGNYYRMLPADDQRAGWRKTEQETLFGKPKV